jgi:hypothetical protein
MECQEIHNGLEKSEIRDFLAKNTRYGYDGEVDFLEKEIARLNEQLEKAKTSQASRDLIKTNGWKEHDVSDEVKYNEDSYFHFVGTAEEYDDFMSNFR